MGRYLTKTVFLVLTSFLLLHLLIPSSSGASFNSNENVVCISKGGRFPPYESQGKPPKYTHRDSAEEPCYGSKASFEPFIEYLVQIWENWRERQARIQRDARED